MKKLFLIVSVLTLVACSSFSQDPVAGADSTVISFSEKEFDYGKVAYEGNGIHEFIFTNTGNKDLILTNVQTSCGCTTPEWPREPIKPGNKAIIKVKYDTKRQGPFEKSITVYSNAKNSPVVLKIRGTVDQVPSK